MKKKILIVDDDANQHKINHYYFTKHGFEVVSAYNGEEGLKKVLSERPALILLDFMMPGMNGDQFLYLLLNDPQYKDVSRTPVVMLTAAGHERSFVERLMERGLSAYLQKPFGEHELINVVENVLVNHEKYVHQEQNIENLRESLDFLSNILQNFPGIIFTTSLDGRISFFTEGSNPMLETPKTSILGRLIFDIFDIQPHELQSMLSRLKNDNTAITIETVLRDHDSRTIPVELSLSIFRDKNGHIAGILGLVKDLTLVKKLEQEKIEKERMTAIVQAMATVNHEINNPLTPILGNLELIMEEAHLLPDSIRTRLKNIQENARRIAENVQKMRNISRPVFKQYYDGEMIIDLDKSR